MPREDRLVDQILGEHRLAEAVRRHDDHVFPLRQKVEGQDALDGRAMDLGGPRPFEIRQRLEAPEARVLQAPFDTLPEAGLEFGLDEAFELDDGTPALLRGARDEVIQVGGGVDEAELAQLITQRRRDRIG